MLYEVITVYLRVVTNHLEYLRVDHAGAENLQPAGLFAYPAAFARNNFV